MSKKKIPTISDALRRAIAESGLTLYRIAKDTGLVKSSLMRFVAGETSLRIDRVDVLAEYLGLDVKTADSGSEETGAGGRGRKWLSGDMKKPAGNGCQRARPVGDPGHDPGTSCV
ncbi:MAG: helix-turn-helix transcriptional regulator [Thermoguttaceae bacterium]